MRHYLIQPLSPSQKLPGKIALIGNFLPRLWEHVCVSLTAPEENP